MAPRDISRLPVVARNNPRQLVGVVRRNNIVRAYEVGALRREEARRRAEVIQEISDTHANFVDIPLVIDSRAVGKTIAELNLPQASVLVAIRRGHALVIPHGKHRLESGDIITALCENDDTAELQMILSQSDETSRSDSISQG